MTKHGYRPTEEERQNVLWMRRGLTHHGSLYLDQPIINCCCDVLSHLQSY